MELYGVNTPMVAMIGGTLSYEFGLGGETPGIVQTELISVFCCILPVGCHNCGVQAILCLVHKDKAQRAKY